MRGDRRRVVLSLASDVSLLEAAATRLSQSLPEFDIWSFRVVAFSDPPTKAWRLRHPGWIEVRAGGATQPIPRRLMNRCRSGEVAIAITQDHESARFARVLATVVPRLLAVHGTEQGIRALQLGIEPNAAPGGRSADVWGETRFVRGLRERPRLANPDRCSARLVIGPCNTEGQASDWAVALTGGAVQAHSFQIVDGQAAATRAADLTISSAEWQQAALRRRFTEEIFGGVSHVLVEGLRPVLSQYPAGDSHAAEVGMADALSLQARGAKVGLVLGVTDLLDQEAALDAWGVRKPATLTGESTRVSLVRRLVEDAAMPVFVTEPSLQQQIPGAQWLPVLCGPRPVPPAGPIPRRQPLVATAPWPYSGHGREPQPDPVGDLVAAAAPRLGARHLRLALVPPGMWPMALASATVVVDRVVLPGLSRAGLLALSLGRQVVAGHAAPAGAPVTRASAADLTDALSEALSSADEQPGGRGPSFVTSLHLGDELRDRAIGFLSTR